MKEKIVNRKQTSKRQQRTLEEQEAGKGVGRGTKIAESLNTGLDDIRRLGKGIPVLQSMVSFRRLREVREPSIGPVKVSAVNNNTSNSGTMSTNPLGCGMDDNISTMLKGTDQVSTSTESVVNNQGHTGIMGNLGNGSNVGDDVLGVGNGFDENGLGLGVDQLGKGLGLIRVGELDLDSQTGEEDLELVVGAAVQVGGGNDVVAGLGQGADGQELGGLAGRGGDGADSALEGRNALLEHIRRGVSDSFCR